MAARLTYFPLRGRAEAIRLVLEYVGATYEDKKVSFEEWGAIKPTLPFGQIPFYEDEDVKIPQSMAIVRHLGRKYSLTLLLYFKIFILIFSLILPVYRTLWNYIQ